MAFRVWQSRVSMQRKARKTRKGGHRTIPLLVVLHLSIELAAAYTHVRAPPLSLPAPPPRPPPRINHRADAQQEPHIHQRAERECRDEQAAYGKRQRGAVQLVFGVPAGGRLGARAVAFGTTGHAWLTRRKTACCPRDLSKGHGFGRRAETRLYSGRNCWDVGAWPPPSGAMLRVSEGSGCMCVHTCVQVLGLARDQQRSAYTAQRLCWVSNEPLHERRIRIHHCSEGLVASTAMHPHPGSPRQPYPGHVGWRVGKQSVGQARVCPYTHLERLWSHTHLGFPLQPYPRRS